MIAAGEPELVAQALIAAMRFNPGSASAHHHLAQILDSLGQEEKAMAGYQAAVALKSNWVAAQLRLGHPLCRAGSPGRGGGRLPRRRQGRQGDTDGSAGRGARTGRLRRVR